MYSINEINITLTSAIVHFYKQRFPMRQVFVDIGHVCAHPPRMGVVMRGRRCNVGVVFLLFSGYRSCTWSVVVVWVCELARSAAAATLHGEMKAAFCCVRGDKGFVATPPDT